jgi:uncharacterized surface protein with fasciclin (FAS1) repeats
MCAFINKCVLMFLFVELGLHSAASESILDTLGKRSQYSKFTNLLKTTEGVHTGYLDNYVTVFAPSNVAMDAFHGLKDQNFILNHMVSSSIATADMGERLTSLMPGHPPIWVRMISSNLYVNQARVVFTFELQSDSGKKQFLYLIDSVLEPLVPKDEKVEEFIDLKAGNLLTNSDYYRTGGFSTKKFAERLKILGLGKGNFTEFNNYGKFTFFLPVDSAFEHLTPNTIDYEVVRAHIVPDRLMFTKPQKRRVESMPTLQYDDSRGSSNLRVMAKVFVKDKVARVESQTVVGTKAHKRGTVEAKIVKANIPVQNGIVHLIDRPLVVMASTLWEHLCKKKVGKHNIRFKDFSEYLQKSPRMCERINKTSEATILVPTNEAFRLISASAIDGALSEHAERILGLHFIEHPPAIHADDVRITNPQDDSGMFSVSPVFPENSEDRLWLWNQDGKLHVDGGGVEAEVVEANVGASNGVIHSINRVLGIPQDTVKAKLSMDPMMSNTFDLGTQEHFNEQLNNKDVKFTYLVPTDQAWQKLKTEYATAHKVLFMGDYYYQVHHLLERHLQVGKKLSLAELVNVTRNGEGFEVMRGPPLQVLTEEENGESVTKVTYDGIVARVVRANIECTNGYIHLIDRVVMKRRDITMGMGSNVLPSIIAIFTAWALSSLLH